MSVNDQAYVIHTAHYQETSALVKLLTCDHGVVSAVVRGIHQPSKKGAALRAAVQLGNLVECQWSGKTSLKTIYHVDLVQPSSLADAGQFVCLAYVHELLLYFLREEFVVDEAFSLYQALLQQFTGGETEKALRAFEFRLLESLGYGIDFGRDAGTDSPVDAGLFYRLVPGSGLRQSAADDRQAFAGSYMQAIQQLDFDVAGVLPVAKKISRQLLAYHMEGKPIRARQMYRELFDR